MSDTSTRVVAAVIACVAVGAAAAMSAQSRRAALDGVWILAGNPTIELMLTPVGEAARARYDYLKDDPAMRCIPASFTRVMHTPSPPIEMRQQGDEVEINYEFMDVHRRVPIKPGLAAKDAPYTVKAHPHLGRSVGRYNGDVLVIDTVDQGAGILDTLGAPGLVQSDQMRTEERFIPNGNGNRMTVVVTHHDAVYYAKPLIVTFSYQRLPGGEILPWDCTPEKASYDAFPTKSDNQR
ncbi:MAG: hypothetical protein ACRD3C_26445 [Vicinamibacterales bacterium]